VVKSASCGLCFLTLGHSDERGVTKLSLVFVEHDLLGKRAILGGGIGGI
jgi:hypothetical protein